MSPVSPLPVILTVVLALASSSLLARRFGMTLPTGRVSTIDGLRGYLAIGVFLYHACIWFFYLRSGIWEAPPSRLYTHMGQTAVVVFFMVTGFLFTGKLLDARTKPLGWAWLYTGRLFRLAPLYLFAMAVMLLMVAALSGWQLRQSPAQLAAGIAHWLAFTWADHPDLNGVAHTGLITAGASWTLRYEWAFYLTLPLLALVLAARPPPGYIAMALAVCVAVYRLHLSALVMTTFAGGIAAAVLVRHAGVRAVAASPLSGGVVLACLVSVVRFFPTPYSLRALLLLSLAFVLIAGGNTLFGLLTHASSRLLGEMTYSIYILHGIVLFGLFRFGLGLSAASRLSALGHWSVIALCTPLLIALCFFTFRWIELPGMRAASTVMRRVASLHGKASPPHPERS